MVYENFHFFIFCQPKRMSSPIMRPVFLEKYVRDQILGAKMCHKKCCTSAGPVTLSQVGHTGLMKKNVRH